MHELSKLLRNERAQETKREQGAYLKVCNALLQAHFLIVKGDLDLAMGCLVAAEQEVRYIQCPIQWLDAQNHADKVWKAHIVASELRGDEHDHHP
jgi:hypothetical protein